MSDAPSALPKPPSKGFILGNVVTIDRQTWATIIAGAPTTDRSLGAQLLCVGSVADTRALLGMSRGPDRNLFLATFAH